MGWVMMSERELNRIEVLGPFPHSLWDVRTAGFASVLSGPLPELNPNYVKENHFRFRLRRSVRTFDLSALAVLRIGNIRSTSLPCSAIPKLPFVIESSKRSNSILTAFLKLASSLNSSQTITPISCRSDGILCLRWSSRRFSDEHQ